MKSYSLTTTLLLGTTLLVAANCGGNGGSSTDGDTTLVGHVSDGDGSQTQSLKIRSGNFGGSGSVSAAITVRVSKLNADGTLEVVAQGSIQGGGRYQIGVPAGLKRLVVESVDASGNVVASAIVEATGKVGETITVAPIDTETSVEAAVMAKLAASGVALDDINCIDLRDRISRSVAVAVKAAADSDVKIKALAEAIAAAQVAKIKGYAAVGITTSQSALFDAELAAAQKLDAALDAAAGATAAADQAYVTFHDDLMTGLKTVDSSVKKHARAESISSVSFRAVVKARLGVSGDVVADAALRACAGVEGRVSAAVIDSILVSGQAATDVTTAARTAATTLVTQLQASANATAVAAAFATWGASISGTTSVTGSVLGNYMGVTVATAATLQLAVSTVYTAAATLDTALNLTASALSATGAIDYNVLAQSIVTAYTAFQSTVDLQVAALASFGAKAQAGVDVLATASGTFRLR